MEQALLLIFSSTISKMFKTSFSHQSSLHRPKVCFRLSRFNIEAIKVSNVLVWVWMLFDWNKVACTWFNPWKACLSKFSPNLTNQSLACHSDLQSQNSLRNMCLDWPNDILHVINLLLDTIYHYRELVWIWHDFYKAQGNSLSLNCFRLGWKL